MPYHLVVISYCMLRSISVASSTGDCAETGNAFMSHGDTDARCHRQNNGWQAITAG